MSEQKSIASNCTLETVNGRRIYRFHGTVILVIKENQELPRNIWIYNGEYRSRTTTKKCLNKLLRQEHLAFHVHNVKGEYGLTLNGVFYPVGLLNIYDNPADPVVHGMIHVVLD